jgi:glycosyltransferase involved in cell wall biosynthesis
MSKEKIDLSAIVIALNEEKNIQRCLESLAWADEIVLVDSGSQDRTKELASKYTDKIFDFKWDGFGKSKEYAKNKAKGVWVLSIDCDEVVSDKLRDEISTKMSSPEGPDGYFIPRKSNFLGRWIKHSGWYPDYVLRLFRRGKGSFTLDRVHERVMVNGTVGHLENELLHYTDPNLHHYLIKLNQYTTDAALEMHQQGKEASLSDMIFRPMGIFLKTYLLRVGFLDGMEGLTLAFCSAFHVFFKYAKLWHLNKNKL